MRFFSDYQYPYTPQKLFKSDLLLKSYRQIKCSISEKFAAQEPQESACQINFVALIVSEIPADIRTWLVRLG